MLPNLRSLLAFEVVVRLKSFSKAAEELCVTQPAVSYQIKSLEEYFGVSLIDRSGPTPVLTPEGLILYQDLTLSLQLMRRGVSQLRAYAKNQAIEVSVRSHFAYKWLSPNLVESDFDFDIRFLHSNDPVDFSKSSIDISIEWLHRACVPDDAIFLLAGNLTPACHPALLEGVKDTADPALLRNAVLLQENDSTTWDEWLAEAGFPELQPLRNEYYSDTNVRQNAAVERRGFALIVPELMSNEIANGLLVCPFGVHLDTFAYYLRVSDRCKGNRKVWTFVDWITGLLDAK